MSLLTIILAILFVSWISYRSGFRDGNDYGWFKGYDQGRIDAKKQVIELLNKH